MRKGLNFLIGFVFLGLVIFFVFDTSKDEIVKEEKVQDEVVTTASKKTASDYYDIEKKTAFQFRD